MCALKPTYAICIWLLFQLTIAYRRIHNGQPVESKHPYTVYILKAPPSERKYLGWTCGGAIVSKDFILTAAACLEDVKHMYVIAGYDKFVDPTNLESNECTKSLKKKIVQICVPKAYEFEFTPIEKWSSSDIGLAKVESPFDFEDSAYTTLCSYKPTIIDINYEGKYQNPGTDCLVMGWGHNDTWREENDTKSYNSDTIKYASIRIINKTICLTEYNTRNETSEKSQFQQIIDKYMICTDKNGNIDDSGNLVSRSKPDMEGCITMAQKLRGAMGPTCVEGDEAREEIIDEIMDDEYPREAFRSNYGDQAEYVVIDYAKGKVKKRYNNNVPNFETGDFFRRNGICQNDHGSPLVTWVGGHKVVIGVASVFKITKNLKCTGPYLFTSTQCNGKFLDCILNPEDKIKDPSRLRRNCHGSPKERGFDMTVRRISWANHPDGPADNERIEIRPQRPILDYHHSLH